MGTEGGEADEACLLGLLQEELLGLTALGKRTPQDFRPRLAIGADGEGVVLDRSRPTLVLARLVDDAPNELWALDVQLDPVRMLRSVSVQTLCQKDSGLPSMRFAEP